MDPTTRRYLWDVLTGVTQEGRTIVLTSHRFAFTHAVMCYFCQSMCDDIHVYMVEIVHPW